MATWKIGEWTVTDEDVPLTTLGDKGLLVERNGKVSLIEHRKGSMGRYNGYWRYFLDYYYASVLQEKALLLSPRGKGKKTASFEDALRGVGMNKEEAVEALRKYIGAEVS